jgi:serine/threonine protein kinase
MNDPNQTVDEPGRESGSPVSAASTPTHIGRYWIEKVLGRGGFGLVYLAHDDQLQRLVAIKVPHLKLVDRPEAYLTEARTVANLDHPNIVPVHDVAAPTTAPATSSRSTSTEPTSPRGSSSRGFRSTKPSN